MSHLLMSHLRLDTENVAWFLRAGALVTGARATFVFGPDMPAPYGAYVNAGFFRFFFVVGTSPASRCRVSSASRKLRRRAMFSRTETACRATSTRAFLPSSAAILRRFALAMLSGEGSPDFLPAMYFPHFFTTKTRSTLGPSGHSAFQYIRGKARRASGEREILRAHLAPHLVGL
jgi:hypothetical protein